MTRLFAALILATLVAPPALAQSADNQSGGGGTAGSKANPSGSADSTVATGRSGAGNRNQTSGSNVANPDGREASPGSMKQTPATR